MDLVDDTLLEFDLDTLEPLEPTPGTTDESNTPDESSTPDQSPDESHRSSPDNLSTNNAESDIESDESGIEFYEIDTDSDDEELPTYPITNLDITEFLNDLPELVPFDPEDVVSDWDHEILDSGPQTGPFHGHAQTTILDPNGKPEVFFNALLMKECGLFYLNLQTPTQGQNVKSMMEIVALILRIQTIKSSPVKG